MTLTPARLAVLRAEATDRLATVAAGELGPTGDSMLVPAGDVLALCDAADTPPSWANGPSHMLGWEAFGCTGRRPVVRRLGIVTFGKNGHGPATTEEQPGTEPFDASAIEAGVSSVKFITYADHPAGAYLYACGPDKDAVELAWHRADSEWTRLAIVLWPAAVPS